MAIIHRATITPSKLEMVAAYLPGVPALAPFVDASLSQIGAYRFDDPAGDVGIETLILTNDAGAVLQVPLTYRGAPVDGLDDALLGTMEHSVLGDRWIYDACREPVYMGELAGTILSGGVGAREVFSASAAGEPEERTPSVTVQGTGEAGTAAPSIGAVEVEMIGTDSHLRAADVTIVLPHVLDAADTKTDSPALLGTWVGLDEPVVLATVV